MPCNPLRCVLASDRKRLLKYIFALREINTMQDLMSYCEPALIYNQCIYNNNYTVVTTAATLLTSNSTRYNYSNISPSKNPSSEKKLTSLVVGISTPLLVIVLVLLVIVTIMAIVWIKERKATKNVHNEHDTEFEDQDRQYETLTRQEYPDITIDHATDALYAVIDMNRQGEERETKHNEENPPIPVEKKGQVALKDLYAVVDKQQKKKQNEETPPALSNPVDGVYYNTAAIRKEHAAEDEEIPPKIPPHMIAL